MSPKNLITHDSDPEEQTAEFVRKALEALNFKKPKKVSISIRLDADVLEHLKQMTDGKYQPAINRILRVYTEYPVDKLDEALGEDAFPSVHAKKPTSIRMDEDVLAWFKDGGEGYQTKINQVLRTFMVYSKGARVG
jgi:uncharacterized protein (DUF4415 family)